MILGVMNARPISVALTAVLLFSGGCRAFGGLPDPSRAEETLRLSGRGSGAMGSVSAYEKYTLAEVLYENGDLNAAIHAVDSALSYDPDDTYLAARLAVMLVEADELHRARRLILRVLSRDPMNELAWLALAMWHRKGGEHDKATAAAKRAIRVDPSSVDASLWLAGYKRSMGQNAYAAEVLSQAAERQPDNAEVQLALGRVRLDLGQPSAARRHFAKFLSLKSYRFDVVVDLARAHEKSGDRAGAADLYEQALAGDPTNDELRIRLIRILLDLNEMARAERHIHSLPPADPGDIPGVLDRARFLARAGDLYGARALLVNQLAEDPRNSEVILFLAAVEIRLGRLEAAELLLGEPGIPWSETERRCRISLQATLTRWPEAEPGCGAVATPNTPTPHRSAPSPP